MIEDAIASAINGGGSATVADIALLRNGRLSGASSVVAAGANDDFVRRLVDVVRREPALYDPSHEHYGNRHASTHFRTAIWQRLCKELDYPDDPQALQKQWKSIRDKYIKEKKRRKGGTTTMMDHSESTTNGTRNFNVLGWLDDYIGDNANAVSSRLFHSVPSTSGESSSAFLLTKSELNNSTLLNGGGGSLVLKEMAAAALATSSNNGNTNGRLSLGKRGAAMTAKPVTKRQHNGGGECTANGSSPSSSAGSEISVGSAAAATVAFGGTAAAGGGGQQQQHPNAILLPQLRHLPTNVNGITTNGNNNTFGSFNGTASSAGVGRLLRARQGIGSNSHHDQLQQIGGGQHQLQHQFCGGRLSLHHQQPLLYKLKEEELLAVTSGGGTNNNTAQTGSRQRITTDHFHHHHQQHNQRKGHVGPSDGGQSIDKRHGQKQYKQQQLRQQQIPFARVESWPPATAAKRGRRIGQRRWLSSFGSQIGSTSISNSALYVARLSERQLSNSFSRRNPDQLIAGADHFENHTKRLFTIKSWHLKRGERAIRVPF